MLLVLLVRGSAVTKITRRFIDALSHLFVLLRRRDTRECLAPSGEFLEACFLKTQTSGLRVTFRKHLCGIGARADG